MWSHTNALAILWSPFPSTQGRWEQLHVRKKKKKTPNVFHHAHQSIWGCGLDGLCGESNYIGRNWQLKQLKLVSLGESIQKLDPLFLCGPNLFQEDESSHKPLSACQEQWGGLPWVLKMSLPPSLLPWKALKKRQIRWQSLMWRHWPLANDRFQTLIISGSRSLRAELLTFSKDSRTLNVPTCAEHLQPEKIPQWESLGLHERTLFQIQKKQSRLEASHSDLQAGIARKLFQTFFTLHSFLWPTEALGSNLCSVQAHVPLFWFAIIHF